jgi:TonB family protein
VMPASRLPASQWLRLAFSLALSLTLHGITLSSFGPLSVLVPGSVSGIPPSGLTVRLAAIAAPIQAVETPRSFIQIAPELHLPPSTQGQASTAATDTVAAANRVADSASKPSPVGPSGIISGPWYYSARYLHRRPTPLKPIRPAYPPFVGDLAGHVVLLMLINEQGTVDTHRIVKAEPAGIFDEAVVAAFIKERYAPGLITGRAVKSQLLVEVVFEPGADPRTGVLLELPR